MLGNLLAFVGRAPAHRSVLLTTTKTPMTENVPESACAQRICSTARTRLPVRRHAGLCPRTAFWAPAWCCLFVCTPELKSGRRSSAAPGFKQHVLALLQQACHLLILLCSGEEWKALFATRLQNVHSTVKSDCKAPKHGYASLTSVIARPSLLFLHQLNTKTFH